MDFNIHLAAKNEVMSYVNVILPVAGTIVGVLIGLFGNGWLERRKRQDEIKGIRSALCMEMGLILNAVKSLEIDEVVHTVIARMDIRLDDVTRAPIYDAYVGQLSRLKESEFTKINAAYSAIKAVNGYMQNLRSRALDDQGPNLDEIIAIKNSWKLIPKRTSEALKEMKYKGADNE